MQKKISKSFKNRLFRFLFQEEIFLFFSFGYEIWKTSTSTFTWSAGISNFKYCSKLLKKLKQFHFQKSKKNTKTEKRILKQKRFLNQRVVLQDVEKTLNHHQWEGRIPFNEVFSNVFGWFCPPLVLAVLPRDDLPRTSTLTIQPPTVGHLWYHPSEQQRYLNPYQQHQEFPSSLPYKYQHVPMLLKPTSRIGAGVSNIPVAMKEHNNTNLN